ncbi:sulfite exporter TauE/SafE family protein [Gilvimarinus sp. DA14]|uniref:sulfite exporter TauE/SafE family protein n=1 Tax=Gilvimarinus sp. DA14 TaxID=2956798 RepID=UPI0020B6811C|nr:sulfite exporter TauE/SafE family protein [Gilvimarinus sp. DA14]UTF60051.1 sulfite exporter TauE/SafE family protein [Gilvimarinus sp. DA14]
MAEPLSLAAGLLLGFFSSSHCVGMCGGIMGALTLAVGQVSGARKMAIVVSYNIGRIASYTLMGALVALAGEQLTAMGAGNGLRLLAALLLLAMALYLLDWWRGLTHLEALGGRLWRFLQPWGQRLMPVRTPGSALLLGAIWGWLPCGLVYTALSYAMLQASSAAGAGFMFAFGVGTLPAVILVAVAADPVMRLMRARKVRILAALLLVIFAIWTAYGAMGGHSHQHHESSDRPSSVLPASENSPEPHQHHHHSH